MISWVYNNHCVILIFHLVFLWANIKEKTCWNVPRWWQNQSKWSILMASFWQQFLHSKSDFWLNPAIPEKFYIFWGWDEQKCCNYSPNLLIRSSKYLSSGWLYKETKGTLPEVQLLESIRFRSSTHLLDPDKSYRDQRSKNPRDPEIWHFSPHHFLGLQQSIVYILILHLVVLWAIKDQQEPRYVTTVMAESQMVRTAVYIFLTAIFA